MGRKRKGDNVLTAAERQRLWRQRNKGSEKLNSVKKQESEQKASRLQKLKVHPEEYGKFRKSLNEYERTRRYSKKLEKYVASAESPADSPASPTEPTGSSKAAINRSKNRMKKVAPKAPGFNAEVCRGLFSDSICATPRKRRKMATWMISSGTPSRRCGRPAALSDVAEEKLLSFLHRTDISYTIGDKNHQVYVGKENGVSKFLNKRYLQWTYPQLACILSKEEDTDLKAIKRSTMYRFICKHKEIVGQGHVPEESCLCPTCEGMELVLEGINKKCDNCYPTTCHDLLKLIACDPIREDCSKGDCVLCTDLDLGEVEQQETIGNAYIILVLCNFLHPTLTSLVYKLFSACNFLVKKINRYLCHGK